MKKINLEMLQNQRKIPILIGFFIFLSIISVIYRITLAENVPSAPSSLTHSSVTSSSVSLSWVDNADNEDRSNEDRFSVQRKLSSASWNENSSITSFLISQPNITSYVDTTVTVGATYDYRVTACLTGTGCSNFAYLSGISITSAGSLPSSPSVPITIGDSASGSGLCSSLILNLAGNKTTYILGESVNYTWTCSSGGTATNVSIWLQKPDGSSTLYNSGSGSSTMILGFSTSNLAIGAHILKACFSSTCSTVNASQTFTVTTGTITTNNIPLTPTTAENIPNDINQTPTVDPVAPITNNVPNPPTNLVLNANQNSSFISINWKDNANNEDRFTVQRKLSTSSWDNFTTSVTSFLIPQPNVISYIDTSVIYGAVYDYRVAACKISVGCSLYVYLSGVSISTSTTNIVSPNTTNTIPLVPSVLNPNTTIQQNISTTQTTDTSLKIQNLGLAMEQVQTALGGTQEQLIRIVNDSIAEVIKNAELAGRKIDLDKINTSRENLLKKVNSSVSALTTITPANIDNIKTEISKGIDNIKSIVGTLPVTEAGINAPQEITTTLNTLAVVVNDQSSTLNDQDANLLYKDTNKDGISDYDSVYVYNMSPTAPSPVSNYGGKSINASEKILLGFDPTKSEIVQITKQQPAESTASIIPTYKVNEVALTDKKEIVLKGKALPNSFITIYIYSTPIIVTLKTDSKGEWEYTLDKELENGDHIVYTATVNNSGNIIAKSPAYLFTKTAEAVTLRDIPQEVANASTNKPGLLEGNNLYIFFGIILLTIILILILVGFSTKKINQ